MSRSAVVIICTRPDSRRLPRKAFRPVAGVRAIEHILHRLSNCGLPVVLAVPTGCAEYNYLPNKYRDELSVEIFEGTPDSPLHRMAQVMHGRNEKWIVRITHDDILIDQKTMLDLIDACEEQDAVYGSSPTIVEGAGVEVFARYKLVKAARDRIEPTEFVSYFVKSVYPDKNIQIEPRHSIKRNYRLTMDFQEDAIVLETLLRNVGPFATLDRVVEFLDQHPSLLNINHQPLVSVYTCAYNGEKYIQSTISSVLSNASNLDMEYILVDDGSTDQTILVASQFADDKRMRIFMNSENLGLASSSNRAIDAARGKYIMRVDADDWIVKGAIHEMVRCIEDKQAGVVYSAFHETDGDGNVIMRNVSPEVNHHAGCALMDKRLLNEVRFKDGLRHWDSMELYRRMRNKVQIAYLGIPLWYYRRHGESLSMNHTTDRGKALADLLEELS